jgi:tRNA (cmo5U34)-methyltransferase
MSETVVPEGWSTSDTEVFLRYGDACVPRRAEQVATVCDLLGDIPVPHVLDLCCGEGLLSEAYLRRHASGRVTILDGSEQMLVVAARRLAPFGDRYTAIQADIADSCWRDPSAGYGGVMTSLAVHHLDGAGKQALYRDIRAMLAPGGVFVMADLVEPTGPAARTLAADDWDAAVWAASEALFGSDEAVIAFRETHWNYYRLPGPDEVDRPSSVAEHLAWLQAAGFTEVDLTWMYAGHAIFTATRRQDLDAP